MWAEVDGERKKVACGPCIRGHRSSKCDHRDRVLVEVRKPGRPLSSCPHPTGSCSCERIIINYTIPKTSECACPSDRAAPAATVAGNSRVQKNRRKSTALNPATLEKALRTGVDAETDTSSVTYTPSETSGSNAASLPSSASSTPRLLPSQNNPVSSCCKPKPAQPAVQQGGCCSSKANPAPEPPPKKSCCSGSSSQVKTVPNNQASGCQSFTPQQFQFPVQPQVPMPLYQNFQPHATTPASNPFGPGTPIYNHAAAAYQQQPSMSNSPMSHSVPGSQVGRHVPEHNCHCGESCSCFGCAAHPNNATMMEYVRVMAHFQYTGGFGTMAPPLYDMPTYPHQAGYGAEAGQSMQFNTMQQGMTMPTPTQMNFQTNIGVPNSSIPSMAIPGNWQQPTTPVHGIAQPQYNNPLSFTMPASADDHLMPKTEEPTSPPYADSPSDSHNEDTPTLSPSTYFWNQMALPNCSDASGTCQCGDGCACVGCLTHGGHTGQQLETPTTTEPTTFSDFPTHLSLGLNDTTNFLNFDPDPS